MSLNKIATEIGQLELSALVTLYELDATGLGGERLFFHNGTNQLSQPVVWQAQTYQPFPIEAEGFELRGEGPLPRPVLRVANVTGLISVLLRQYGRLQGAKLIRRRTHARFLDAVNFPGAINAQADPTAHYPDDTWIVDRVRSRNALVVEWELASPHDLEGIALPRRQVVATQCCWEYRGPDCGYTGEPVAKADDTPTADPAQDVCGRRLASCRLRWERVLVPGQPVNKELPFGGFPGAGLVRNV